MTMVMMINDIKIDKKSDKSRKSNDNRTEHNRNPIYRSDLNNISSSPFIISVLFCTVLITRYYLTNKNNQ